MNTDYRAELQRLVKAYDDHGGRWPENDVEALHQAVERARALIAADRARWGRPAIEPVPVDERLPEAEDCDGENQCWQWDPKSDAWVLYTSVGLRLRADVAPYWLPHRALPVPQDS